MTKLELRNTRTSKPLFVDAKGAVFGREGGDADIKLADQGVSKKHARIYVRKGEWWLEDLNSANGTYVDDQRISQPVLLSPGLVFTMSRQQFEVVEVVEAQDEATQAPKLPEEEGPDSTQEDEAAQDEPMPPPRRAPAAKPPPPPAAAPRAKKPDAPVASAARAKLQAAGTEADQEIPPEEDVEPGFNVGYFMKAIPKATAYYLGAVPLMLVNPLGYVRNGIENQKVPAMGRMQIMSYAMTAQLISAAVLFVCSLVAQIISRTISIGGIIPIVPLITAVVVGIVSGFVYHPVLTWIVDKLQGQSDAKSRSNMFAMMMTLTVLLALPSGLTTLFAAIPVRFVILIPLLIQLAATGITLFVAYSWFKFFDVVKWFQLGLIGLGVLAVLGTAATMISTVTASIRGIGSGTTVVAGTPTTPEEAQALVAKQQAEAQKAIDEARAKAAKAQAEAEKNAKATTVASNEEPAKAEPAKVEPAKAEAEPAKVEVASAKAGPETVPAKATPESTPAGSLSYPEYKAKLAAIEKAVEDDPTVLQRVDGLLAAYQQLHRAQFDAEDKVRRSQGRAHPSQTLPNQRLREAEVYKATSNLVEQVHEKLFAR